jgi:MFS family permease
MGDAGRLLLARSLRGFADGVVSVLLAVYLSHLGFAPVQIGAIATGTMLGSAALVIALGLVAHRIDLRRVLLGACGLMFATGVLFASLRTFWPLFAVAVVGTLNPSAGDVSVFLPAEQAALAHAVPQRGRTLAFAWYNVWGALAGAIGALASGAPDVVARKLGMAAIDAERAGFLLYAAIALAAVPVYARLTPAPVERASAPLQRSRRTVLGLSALFSLDSFGGGFVVQSLLVLWLYRRFALDPATAGAIFFAAGVLGAVSQLASARLAARIGHVRTMVFTHLPANVFLILAGTMPTAPLAVLFLLLRASLSSMDVPARQAYVLSVVPKEERAAAASVTNVPRSLAAAVPPLVTGWFLDQGSSGLPLFIAGGLKATYDLLLLWRFARLRPLDETQV